MTTRLVATVLVTDVDSPARYLRQPAEGVDYVELRFDALSEPSPSAVSAVLGLPRTVPVIATCRPVSQGGFFDGEESERMALLATAAEAGADIIDVEDGCLADLPEGLPGDRIASCHLSRFVPRLEALARRLLAHGTTFAKLAVPASTPKHLLDLLDLQAAFADRLSIVPTGRLAEAGRVMAASRGAPFVYGASDPEARGHPDQPTVERLHDVHNVTSLPPDTRFFAVIGKPVAHSMSPAYHNTIFRGVAQSARLVPMEVDRLEQVMDPAEDLLLDGLAITHPFKRDAIDLAHSVLPGARNSVAANTLVRTPAGWQARNTDWKAACDLFPRLLNGWLKQQRAGKASDGWLDKVLEGCWKSGGTPRVKRTEDDPTPKVLLLGAGGAARAIAVALFEEAEIELAVWSRRLSHARDLASQLAESLPAVAIPEPGHMPADIIINATPVGMPGVDIAEFDGFTPENFRPGAVAVDLTYGKARSPFRAAARAAGAPLVTGEFFFGLQARRQSEVFTGTVLAADLRKQAAINCGAVS